jgi:hypothetical protein
MQVRAMCSSREMTADATTFARSTCTTSSFRPTYEEQLLNPGYDASGRLTASGVKVTAAVPSGHPAMRKLEVFHTAHVALNSAALGGVEDRCEPSLTLDSHNRFVHPETCPPQARIGSARLRTPLTEVTVEGEVYLIDGGNMPLLGLYFPMANLSLVANFQLPYLASAPGRQAMATTLEAGFAAGFTGIEVTLGGASRQGVDGTLSGRLFRAGVASEPCAAEFVDTIAEFTSVNDDFASLPSQSVFAPVCIQ